MLQLTASAEYGVLPPHLSVQVVIDSHLNPSLAREHVPDLRGLRAKNGRKIVNQRDIGVN